VYITQRDGSNSVGRIAAELTGLGKTNSFEDDLHQQACIRLNPSFDPLMPSQDSALVTYGSGWLPPEIRPSGVSRWSVGDGRATFFSEEEGSHRYTLTFSICSADRRTSSPTRHLSVTVNGKVVWSPELIPDQIVPVRIQILGHHGRNSIAFDSATPPILVDAVHPRVAFVVTDLKVIKEW
jgi:hypothetical protein